MLVDTKIRRVARLAELEEKYKQEVEAMEQEKKNKDFVQVYRKNMPELRWLMRKNPIAANILFFFLEYMDSKNAIACSYAVLEDYLDIGKDTIRIALKLLKDNGFISVLKSGTSNVYTINYEVAWSSWENQKKYAKLDGVILISHKENKDYEYQKQVERFKTLRKRENIKIWMDDE